mmetsp:Transcript_135131/g.419931  ORF Transcript_135131/g.419931 Transcript_135131/m.419931 type:complete len:215 (+) Transcript_135131:366-1010(+)
MWRLSAWSARDGPGRTSSCKVVPPQPGGQCLRRQHRPPQRPASWHPALYSLNHPRSPLPLPRSHSCRWPQRPSSGSHRSTGGSHRSSCHSGPRRCCRQTPDLKPPTPRGPPRRPTRPRAPAALPRPACHPRALWELRPPACPQRPDPRRWGTGPRRAQGRTQNAPCGPLPRQPRARETPERRPEQWGASRVAGAAAGRAPTAVPSAQAARRRRR